jgi:hypothetical protein
VKLAPFPKKVDGIPTDDIPNRVGAWMEGLTREQQRRYHRACRLVYHGVPHFLYRHFDSEGTLLYVGVTITPHQRSIGHRSTSPWWSDVAHISYEMHPTAWVAWAHEEHAIKTERPLYNVAHSDDYAAASLRRRERALRKRAEA